MQRGVCLPRKVTPGPAALRVRMRPHLCDVTRIGAGPRPMTGTHTRGSVDAKTHGRERGAPVDRGRDRRTRLQKQQGCRGPPAAGARYGADAPGLLAPESGLLASRPRGTHSRCLSYTGSTRTAQAASHWYWGQQHSRACGVPAVARLEGPRPHPRVPTCPWSLVFPTQSEAITEEEAPQTPASVTGGCVKLWSGTILICADDAFVSLTTCIERDHLEAKWPTCHGHPCGPPQDRHSQRRPQGTPACGQCLVLHSNLNLDSLC